MKIYLAGRYSIRDQLKEYRDTLRMNGHEVTSRWLDFEDDNPDAFPPDDGTASSHAAPELRQMVAQMDVDDVKDADAIMLFTSELGRRGGMFVEWGIAIALDKVLVLIGPEINVFQHYPGTLQYNSFEEALDFVEDWGERWKMFGPVRATIEVGGKATNGLRSGIAIERLRVGAIAEIDVINNRVRNMKHSSSLVP